MSSPSSVAARDNEVVPTDDGAAANPHAAWRMEVARRAAAAYTSNPKLAALTVGGSVGAGLADRYSDLELDCYWSQAPTDADRTTPVEALGGKLTQLWDYDADEEEWSEDFQLDELGIAVSNFLTSTIDRWLDGVVRHADTDPVKHMRLAALQRSQVLMGQPLIDSWRAHAARYPDRLVTIMVEQALDPAVLGCWGTREALVSRGDDLAAQALLSRIGYAVAGTVLALNRVYLPHRQLKWQRHLLANLELAPDHLNDRLDALTSNPAGDAIHAAEQLLNDTVHLAETHSDADLTAFRADLTHRRQPLDPPTDYGQAI
jgi:hypothetical protein